jgi:N-methylhydantoinase A
LSSNLHETFIGIDVGGTFTDVILYNAGSKETRVIKVSTSPKKIEEAIVNALSSEDIDPSNTKMISHATTTATNALLTSSSLAKTALVTNVGFRDVLEIGRQRRPEIYNLYSRRPTPLVKRHDRYTIESRMLYDGKELEPVQETDVRRVGRKLAAEKYDCVVVGLLNSYANPSHEVAVEKIISKDYGGRIVTSSSVNNEYREYERFSTAVVNAALIPLVSNYLDNLSKSLKIKGFVAPIYIMNSDGNVSSLAQASKFPISIIESGPAAGVLACADLAKSLSLLKVATFDMGGTTAKAGMITNYEPDISYEFEASGSTHSGRSIKGSGYPVRYPFVDLAEVSSGGGTIAWVDDGGALRLGPKSAGAEPGPAAYGKGGVNPTITDANIILGRLSPVHLLGGKMKMYPELARKAISEHVAEKLGLTVKEASHAIIRLVNHNMARAISIVSVERGRDPREYTLFSFGGAGPKGDSVA